MRTVKNILDAKPKATNIIRPDMLVIEALEMLISVNLSYLIVMDGEEYRGIFSERDYSRNVILKGRASKSTRVEEVMATDLPTVSFTDTVENCMHLLSQHRTRYLLAQDATGKFAGVITIHDLLRQVITDREDVFNSAAANRLIDHDEGGEIY